MQTALNPATPPLHTGVLTMQTQENTAATP